MQGSYKTKKILLSFLSNNTSPYLVEYYLI